MSYLALYRKYRSQNFDEIYGQKAIIKTLKNMLEEGKVSHAYLFSGPRGTGKTSVARLLAKALNCETGLGNICSSCSNCEEITTNSSPDVIEIDAASNSGVDEVRNIIDKIQYLPVKSRYKVYIIDEVHMMSNSAFNALLKTLEEPPEHAIFILCTTELYKVLPTIISRCQRFEFKRLSDEELKELLINVLKKENITYENGVLNEIVELANGGARDALSLLDQVISFSGNNILNKDIENLFGIINKKEKIDLLSFIKDENNEALIKEFKKLQNSRNIDYNRLVNDYLIMFKDALIYKKSNSLNKDFYISMIDKFFQENEILALINSLLELQKELKFANNPELLFEIYLLKLIDVKRSVNVKAETVIKKEVIERVEETPKHIIQEKPIIQPKKEEKYVLKDPFEKKENDSPTTIMKTIDALDPIFKKEPKVKKDGEIEIPSEGSSYFISLDDLIKLSILSDKQAKRELISRWKLLDGFQKEPSLYPFAKLLKEGTPYLLTAKYFIVMFNDENKAKLLNKVINQESLQKVMHKLVGQKMHIYALNRKDSTQLVTQYRNLEEIKKLPKTKQIDINEINFEIKEN